MKIFGSSTYGVHAASPRSYPAALPSRSHSLSTRARVSGALTAASHAGRVGLDAARQIPIGFPLVALAALGGIFGGTLWGMKGFAAGAGLGLLAGFGISKLPDSGPAPA